MSQIPFPLQLKRQFATPLDPDTVFDTLANMNAYLLSGVRYAGMIATCKEIEGGVFVLNNARDAWINISAISIAIIYIIGTESYIEANEHNLGGNIQVDFFEVEETKLKPIKIFYHIYPDGRIYWKSSVYISNGRAIVK